MATDNPQDSNSTSVCPAVSEESETGYSGETLALYRAEYSRQYAKLAGLHPNKPEHELRAESHQAAVRLTELKNDNL